MDLSQDLIEHLFAMLFAFVNDNGDDWDDHLPCQMMADRATPMLVQNVIHLGAFRTSPTDSLYVEANEPPLETCPTIHC